MECPEADCKKPPNMESAVAETQGAEVANEMVGESRLAFHERPMVHINNSINAAERHKRNAARSLHNAGAVELHQNQHAGTGIFLLIAHDVHLSGPGDEWQESIAQIGKDDCVWLHRFFCENICLY